MMGILIRSVQVVAAMYQTADLHRTRVIHRVVGSGVAPFAIAVFGVVKEGRAGQLDQVEPLSADLS
jgi:hypothetical protein